MPALLSCQGERESPRLAQWECVDRRPLRGPRGDVSGSDAEVDQKVQAAQNQDTIDSEASYAVG